jgi:uncharacterized protein (DUF885 family)
LLEVKRIDTEKGKVREQSGFNGTTQSFSHFLRTDPRFYAKSGDELLEYTRARAEEIDPLLVKLFRTFPRLPYGVQPVPTEIAPGMPRAYADEAAPDGSRLRYFHSTL